MSFRNFGPYDPCPCGSGKKYKFCCLDRLKNSPNISLRAPVPATPATISIDRSRLRQACPCESGKIYKRCCYPRTFPDFSKPNAGIPELFLQQAAKDRALKRYAARPERYDQLTINSADVGNTRVDCAAMQPHGETLKGTLAPPTAWQIEAKYEAIRNENPDGITEVVITYSYPEPFGMAEAEMLIDADEHFRLVDGRVIGVLDLFRGMQIRLEEGAVGTLIKSPERRYEIPIPPLKYEDGNWNSRVIGRVKHTCFEILEWSLGGLIIRGTPGHIVWSETRNWWVRACELQPGEMVRGEGNRVLPVERVGPLKSGLVEVFGIEVEYFHNYYVGAGDKAMLVHNGPPCFKRPEVAEALEQGEIKQSGRKAAGVLTEAELNPQHHLFPQAERAWFAQRGMNVDNHTIVIDRTLHEALHAGGGPGRGGGWWNNEMMRRLNVAEGQLPSGQSLTPSQILSIRDGMLADFQLTDIPILPYAR